MEQILIVEDDSFLNKMLDYNLTADGYGVTSALNARTAAEAIRQREFDLVLLDINLPDGNGFELCKLLDRVDRLSENVPRLRIRVRSGRRMSRSAIHGIPRHPRALYTIYGDSYPDHGFHGRHETDSEEMRYICLRHKIRRPCKRTRSFR